MKNILTTLIILLFTVTCFSQTYDVSKIDNNMYDVTIKDGNTTQYGYYINIDGKLLNHGKWVLKSNNKVLTKGIYEKGELIKITVFIDGIKRTYEKRDLEIIRLNGRVRQLENRIANVTE